MKNILKSKNAIINEFSYCPHHPNAINKKYRKNVIVGSQSLE